MVRYGYSITCRSKRVGEMVYAGFLSSGNDLFHQPQLTFADAHQPSDTMESGGAKGTGPCPSSSEPRIHHRTPMMWGWRGASAVGNPGSADYLIWGLSGAGPMSWSGWIASISHASDCEKLSGWKAMCRGSEDPRSEGSVRINQGLGPGRAGEHSIGPVKVPQMV